MSQRRAGRSKGKATGRRSSRARGGPRSSGKGKGAAQRLRIDGLLSAARGQRLRELHEFWGGKPADEAERTEELRVKLRSWMSDPALIEA